MPDWTEELMDDHGRIERALAMVERQIQRSDDFDVVTVGALLEFLFEYGDRYHNHKEEAALFPLLGERGLPTEGGPIAVMLAEHDAERDYLQKLLLTTLAIREHRQTPTKEYRDTLSAYIELTKSHIWKENDILYPMGRRVLTATDKEALIAQFRALDQKLPYSGVGYVERWENLLTAVETAGGGRVDLLASLPTDTVRAMLDTLPVELTFIDAEDTVRFFNRVYEKKIFPRTLSVVGRKVQQCHPPKSVHLVNRILSEMKSGARHSASFWIPFGEYKEMLLHISYYAVRDPNGIYLGCVEMTHDIAPYRALEGASRALGDM